MGNKLTNEIENVANQILDKCESIQLASITEDGFPRICEMEKVFAKNIYEIILITTKNSKKIKHFTGNYKASVGFSDGNNSISLMGCIEIVEMEQIKEQLKNIIEPERWLKKDKNGKCIYCGLYFKMEKADFFINGKKWDYAKSKEVKN